MNRSLTFRTNNGDQTFFVKDLSFYNVVCELEDEGIDLMGMANEGEGGRKNNTTLRAIVSVLLGVDKMRAGDLISEHLQNGGDPAIFNEIMGVFTDNMKNADFGPTPQNNQNHNNY